MPCAFKGGHIMLCMLAGNGVMASTALLLHPAITIVAVVQKSLRLHLVPAACAALHLLQQLGVQTAQPLERWALLLSWALILLDQVRCLQLCMPCKSSAQACSIPSMLGFIRHVLLCRTCSQPSFQDRLLQAAAIMQLDLAILLLCGSDSSPTGQAIHVTALIWGSPLLVFVLMHSTVLATMRAVLPVAVRTASSKLSSPWAQPGCQQFVTNAARQPQHTETQASQATGGTSGSDGLEGIRSSNNGHSRLEPNKTAVPDNSSSNSAGRSQATGATASQGKSEPACLNCV